MHTELTSKHATVTITWIREPGNDHIAITATAPHHRPYHARLTRCPCDRPTCTRPIPRHDRANGPYGLASTQNKCNQDGAHRGTHCHGAGGFHFEHAVTLATEILKTYTPTRPRKTTHRPPGRAAFPAAKWADHCQVEILEPCTPPTSEAC